MNHEIYGECPRHGRYALVAPCCAPAATAFGPADHPDLPLGLRRHPRYAARVLMPVGGELDIVSIYSHDKTHLDAVVMRLWQPADQVEREEWDEEAREWRPS